MAFGSFKTVADAADAFDIVVNEQTFIGEKELRVTQALFDEIDDNLLSKWSYVSEDARCESIISPILRIVAKKNGLILWSHLTLNVTDVLKGQPDYLIAGATSGGNLKDPIVCIAEAKQENFDEGWAQVVAEMVASRLKNGDTPFGGRDIYGIVTTGNSWQFGKLQNGTLSRPLNAIDAVNNLQQIFNIVHWIVFTAKNAETP